MHDDRGAVGVENPVHALERYVRNDELEIEFPRTRRNDVRHVAEVVPMLIVESVHAAFGVEVSAGRRERRLTLSNGVKMNAVRPKPEIAHAAAHEEPGVRLAECDGADASPGGVVERCRCRRAGGSNSATNSAGR